MKLLVSKLTVDGSRQLKSPRAATTSQRTVDEQRALILKPLPPCQIRLEAADRATQAMTLVELMVSVAVGSLMLMVVATVFGNSIKSFAVMGNYVSMDRDSRNALDRMTREIRRAGGLTSFATDRLVFTKYGAANLSLVYQWDGNAHQLTEWYSGSTRTNILLTDCDEFAFTLQKLSGVATTNIAEAKMVSVTWKCSRTLLGKQLATEQMQQAQIIVRNQLL